MKIIFISNFINHHQVGLSDELYKLTDGQYHFVETMAMPETFKKSGYPDFSKRDYVIQAWKNKELKEKSFEVLDLADVVIFNSSEGLSYGVYAAKLDKLAFEVGERWFKRGFFISLCSPRLLINMWYYHTFFRKRKVYKLCSSAFGVNDQYMLHSFKNKCFKWGYFTNVSENFEIKKTPKQSTSTFTMASLMWCGRFLKWKHPELPVLLARKLKDAGYRVIIDMYGSGEELVKTQELANKLSVTDFVKFRGNLPNREILDEMSRHDIFLFTSDKNEGWGAVANEAMTSGCVLVGSDTIGSIPYLVKDGVNGCVFKSCDLSSLFEKVTWLINNPLKRDMLSINAYKTISIDWSPRNAAKNLLQLIEDLNKKGESSIQDGPGSKAIPVRN